MFRCAGRVDRTKGNPVRLAVRWLVKSGAAPATVGGESFFNLPLGFVRQSLGRRRRVMTREPGDLPEHVILPACGARASGRSSAVVTGELSSGWGATANAYCSADFCERRDGSRAGADGRPYHG